MELNVQIPAIDQSFYTPVAAKANTDKIKTVIRPKFGAYIKNISALTGVPEVLLESFIFVESAGDEKAQSPYAVGLLQLSPATASDALVTEKGAGRLEKGESDLLKKYLGSRYSLIEGVNKNQTSIGKSFITVDDLKKPEFNLLVGSILIKQLIDEFSFNRQINLPKIIAIYNGGRYSKAGKKIIPFKGTTKELLTIVPKETSDYVKKLVGTNGVLEGIV